MVIGRDDFDVINQHLQSSETSKKVTFLKRVGVFSQLSSSSLQVISTAMVARTCPKVRLSLTALGRQQLAFVRGLGSPDILSFIYCYSTVSGTSCLIGTRESANWTSR
jgi:hypothetical protein